MTAHAKLSASSAHRWLACPGSVAAEVGLPDRRTVFADEGTVAHELADMALSAGTDCVDFIGVQPLDDIDIEVTQEMADYVQQYVDFVRELGGSQLYEQRVDFSEWVKDGFGTSDAIIIKNNKMTVVDLKFGKGHRVDAEQNPQGILYALGAFSDYGFLHEVEIVEIVIIQPRLDHISVWTTTKDHLFKKGEWISERAALTEQPNAERVPGDEQCQWCKAKGTCAALQKKTHAIIATDFDNLDKIKNPDTLTDDEVRAALDAKKLITSWFDAVENTVTQRLAAGNTFPGYKLVSGRSSRDWGDVAEAVKVLESQLGENAWERKLQSVAKAEKLLGKSKVSIIEPLINKKAGRPTLAKASDPRPAVGASADDFETFDDTGE
tara:strand:- start:1453 stop:2592 length:1140 start_codon:yes stop_codon:yes gene_type:complete